MRRTPLPPARPVRDGESRPRPLFHPRTGGVRRLERAANTALSRHVWPYVPGLRALYSLQLERGTVLSEAAVPVEGLDPALSGLSILLLTDLHLGPFLAPAALARVLGRLAAEAQPDLVVLGGDLATARRDDLDGGLDALAALRAPLGVWGVLGNHDHYTGDAGEVASRLAGAGVRMLRNAAAVLERGAPFTLAGIEDLHEGAPDLAAALPAAAPRPRILVSHNPDAFFDAVRAGADLVLSGHTHGGQIRIPGLPVLVRQSRYRLDEGRYRWGGAELVVSRGLGVTGLPLRLACPPEGVLVRLAPAHAVGYTARP